MKAKRPIKHLKPSMRERKRYILVYGENLREEIEKAILEFIGILGMSKTGLNFIKFDKEKAIISINREMVNQVRASLCIWPKKIEIKKVSGTLKGLSQK